MFYKIFINNRKVLLYLLTSKSIFEKRKKINPLMFKVFKCIYIFESADKFMNTFTLIFYFKGHTNADMKIYQYLCLHMKIIC